MAMGRPVESFESKFWSKVEPDLNSGCWLWGGAANVYGQMSVWLGPNLNETRLAHRLAYEYFVGHIPDGLHLDHKCRTPLCVNPVHLEPVTPRENLARSPTALPTINAGLTHCKRGHEFTDENTYSWRGHRQCMACNRARRTLWRANAGN